MGTDKESIAFSRLNERIQRWIWERNWTEFRDIQESAVSPILEQKKDVIIAAATASGKTEAAFLPICSRLLEKENVGSSVVYISPLKALINDQFGRMEELCEHLNISVHPWHGDIATSKKADFLKECKGILLITPESLEAIFVNHGSQVHSIFSNVLYVVVDELHSFIGSERGQQLQSLLHRIEFSVRKRIPRIALSATLGDMALAAEFLRVGFGKDVHVISSTAFKQEIKLLLRGFVDSAPELILSDDEKVKAAEDSESVLSEIGKSLFNTLRGTSNLIFANSRKDVETYADFLRRLSENNLLPNEFWPHHGSLSKELREEAEAAIKDKSRPVNIICTSTLEMGVDIGTVNSIAQINVPYSVSSMRQRLGRSGRRGDPAILRIYITERELGKDLSLNDELRIDLVQAIAMVYLLVNKWYEPPSIQGLHLSTMIQQILSIIAQYGGLTATQLWKILCASGPFNAVTEKMFIDLLRVMGSQKLLMQANDGLLLHDELGEKIVNHYSFYAAFKTSEEYKLVTESRTLGTLPIDRPVAIDSFLIFGGRRWQVTDVDARKKIIELKPAKAGLAPKFASKGGWLHECIRQEMYKIYMGTETPPFLDAKAKELLNEARENFSRYHLDKNQVISSGKHLYLFCWTGDEKMETVAALLRHKGLKANTIGITVVIEANKEELKEQLNSLVNQAPIDPCELAKFIPNRASEKYDLFLSNDLMCADYAASKLDVVGALET
jgi:ATP-dependent helicase Lhr and Lhr-like helicase